MLAIFISLRKLAACHIIWGAIAQLVERMNGIHEATGSNPVSSTSLRRLCGTTKSSQISLRRRQGYGAQASHVRRSFNGGGRMRRYKPKINGVKQKLSATAKGLHERFA